MSQGSYNENRYSTIDRPGIQPWPSVPRWSPLQQTIKRRRYQRNRQFRRRENGDPSCCCITHLDWTNRFWWARQDLNLGPTDYEFKKGQISIDLLPLAVERYRYLPRRISLVNTGDFLSPMLLMTDA
jgi:hypothetical protein